MLIHPTEIPTNGWDVSFYGFGTAGADRFSIGKPAAVNAKFNMYNNIEPFGGYFYQENTPNINKSVALTGENVNPVANLSIGVEGITTSTNVAASEVIGVKGTAVLSFPSGEAVGVLGVANTVGSLNNAGILGTGSNASSSNFGLDGNAVGSATSASTNYGVRAVSTGQHVGSNNYAISGNALSTGTNYGGYFVSQGNNGLNNYAVTGTASQGLEAYGGKFFANQATNASYGVYTEAPATGAYYALFVNGNAKLINGVATGFGSDSLIKTNIQNVINASQLLSQLQPKTFDFRYNDFPSIRLDQNNHYGVIAQDVEQVIPSLVSDAVVPQVLDSNNNVVYPSITIKTVNYQEFIPLLIAGFNEQQDKIDEQDSVIATMQQQMNDMMAMINNCCSQGNSISTPSNSANQLTYIPTHIDVRLSTNGCVLDVNSPNPFKDNTTINYLIPENSRFAQIIFYNSLGQAIKIVDINDKGAGRLNVYGEDLRSGMYSYSLIIDGNVCETHKMIKQ